MIALLPTSDDLSNILKINAAQAAKGREMDQLTPNTLTDGRAFLSADLLTDCGPGGTWNPWASVLSGMTPTPIDDSLLPAPLKIPT